MFWSGEIFDGVTLPIINGYTVNLYQQTRYYLKEYQIFKKKIKTLTLTDNKLIKCIKFIVVLFNGSKEKVGGQ